MSVLTKDDCPFCRMPPERILASNDHAFAVADAFPVSPGHTLVISRRHVADFFELTDEEVAAVHSLLRQSRQQLERENRPNGINVGINVGTAAGQTVMHAHIHLIPRYRGDVANPTGGVRNLIPGKGAYKR
jgi:diadenosine tetraphosphate (Ap4A) HIT family hydrolase